MGETLAQKIIRAHLLHGDMTPGSEIALRIDQTLTQDATGTMAYLEFETMGSHIVWKIAFLINLLLKFLPQNLFRCLNLICQCMFR